MRSYRLCSRPSRKVIGMRMGKAPVVWPSARGDVAEACNRQASAWNGPKNACVVRNHRYNGLIPGL